MDQQQQQQQVTADSTLHFLDYWRVIRTRKEVILAVLLIIVITGTGVTFMMPKKYMAEARISVRDDTLDVDVFERQMPQTYNPYFLRTQYEIIQSRAILYQVINNLNLQQVWGEQMSEEGTPLSREDALEILSGSVKVEQYRDTSLISIQVFREDPAEAARIANEIAVVYRDQRLSQKRKEIKRALEALESELQKQQERVEKAEAEMERLRKELGVTVLAQGVRADKIRLSQLEADRIAARVDLLVRKAQLDQLENLSGDDLMNASSYIVNDQVLQSIRAQLIDTEVSLRTLLENYGVNHPEVRRLQAGVEELRKKLNNALNGLKAGVRANYEVARQRYEALDKELESVRKSDIEAERERFLPFDKAQQEVEIQRQILDALRARIAQEGIQFEVPRTPVEIVDVAEPAQRPVSPNLFLNVFLSVMLGLSAGIGLAFFIEYLDTSVKTVDDIERYLGLPVLGIIPQKVRPLTEEGPDSPHAEAYRVLKTNLQFANKGVSGGTYVLVSGGVGEGKSTTLFNLAYVCAQLGEKTLIVDSDLRRPVQHRILGVSNRFGLTNVLMRDVPVEETIKVTNIPNLHFLPSGKLPRTSLGLLDSQRMRELVKNLKARYDYVFFDSPPIMGVTDASILASEVDGVLLVIQYRKYPRLISSRAKRMLENVGANVLGVVLNNINIMRDDYYYYYHSYYSHYGPSEDVKPTEETGAETTPRKKDAL